MRIAGLDVGTKTVGVAISDELGWTAQGLETIPIDVDQKNLGFKRIGELIEAYEINLFVVGYPINMNGSVGPRALACQDYAERLEKKFGIPVQLIDERLSTMASERVLIEAGVRRERRKDVIDKMAATIILQNYLDSKVL